jgi:DNA-nicking Smr family endonuclease
MHKLSPEEEFQLQWIQKHGVNPDLKGDRPGETVHESQKQGKKGKPRISSNLEVDEELDLHGEDIESGLHHVEQLIDRARSYGYGRVRIIHGVGSDESGYENLRTKIRRFLKTRARGWIKSWTYDNPSEGSLIINFTKSQD